MAGPRIRESLDGSESNFSLVDHGFANESALSEGGHGDVEDGASAEPSRSTVAVRAYYPISTIMSNPRAASAAQTISTNLSNLNPLRPTTGPKTGATRGRAATPIVLSELPKVSTKGFETYINSIKNDFTAWSQMQSALVEAPVLDASDALDDDDGLLDEEASKRRKAIKRALETSNISSKSGKALELPPLDSIPPIFFEENFNLANPRTFDVVTAGQGVHGVSAGAMLTAQEASTDFAADQILQEKLSYWLDVVEVHLNVEISLRSASFFSALSNLKELDTQSAEAVKQISEIKSILDAVDARIAKKGLYAVRQGVRRRRLNDLDVAVDRIKEILRAVDQAEELGEAGETDGALDMADEIEREWETSLASTTVQIPPTPAVEHTQQTSMTIISEENEDEDRSRQPKVVVPITPLTALRPCGNHHQPVRIAQIRCMSTIPGRLGSLRSAIAQTLEHELVAVLVHAAREGREALSSTTAQWRASPGVQAPVFEELRESTASRARGVLHGLVRCGKPALDDAIVAWREALLKEVRRVMREVLPSVSSHDDDDTPADNTPSSRSSIEGSRPSLDAGLQSSGGIQHLDQIQHVDLIRHLHTSMLALLIMADIQSRAISATVDSILATRSRHVGGDHIDLNTSTEKALNDAWANALQADLTDAVQAVAELINVRLARIVASRGEVHSQLSLFDFYTLFSESWQFVLDCEVICRKMIVGLRGVIVGQAKSFLQHFHQQTFMGVAQAVEHEQWSPTDVPASTQAVVDRILQSAVETPALWDFKRHRPEVSVDDKQVAKQLAVEDRSYFAVTATLRCVEALEDYLKIVINLPLLSTDVMSRIIEFLKQYNSRVCQMVLGAGAMRSAGLKNITAKHLAMASQSISILINIIPYTRECLRRHLRAKQAVILVEFDKLKRDCQEHQNEIHAKLVAIMGDRLAVHCNTLQDIDWEKPASNNGKPNTYMETLAKETGTLHKVLLKYLAGSALEIVMMQVLSAINSRLAEEYSRIPLKSDAAKERMLVDANYLKERFADLKGLERAPPGAELVHLVQDKMIERPAAPVQPKGKSFSTPSMTQSRKALAGHSRSPSTTSIVRAEEPGEAVEAAKSDSKNAPELTTTLAPPDDLTSATSQPVALPQEAVREESDVAQAQAQAEDTPLPMSPEREVPLSILESLAEEKRVTQPEEAAPATPSKTERPLSPPVQAKAHEQTQGTPTVNVKNRLAGLFAKRPSIPSIPVIEIPLLRTTKILPSGHASIPSIETSVAPISSKNTTDPSTESPHHGSQSGLSETIAPNFDEKQSSEDPLIGPTSKQTLPDSSEGSTEVLAVKTSPRSLPQPRIDYYDQSGVLEDGIAPVTKDEPHSLNRVVMAAILTSEPVNMVHEPVLVDDSVEAEAQAGKDAVKEKETTDTQREQEVRAEAEVGVEAEVGAEAEFEVGAQGEADDDNSAPPEVLIPPAGRHDQESNDKIACVDDGQADTSGSTDSTFESDVHSAGTAEHFKSNDDLDEID